MVMNGGWFRALLYQHDWLLCFSGWVNDHYRAAYFQTNPKLSPLLSACLRVTYVTRNLTASGCSSRTSGRTTLGPLNSWIISTAHTLSKISYTSNKFPLFSSVKSPFSHAFLWFSSGSPKLFLWFPRLSHASSTLAPPATLPSPATQKGLSDGG